MEFRFLGEVTCGLFGITEDYEEAYLSLDQHLVKNRESTYFLRAMGNSMTPLILPQDILVVDRSIKVEMGQIVVLTMNGQRLCKRLVRQEGKIFLLSENKNYKPIPIVEESEAVFFGPVVGLARGF
ncbi:MAG: hypothetical protein A2X86_22250 [Bdellovibrionales bacterium GWA2_49_15]|nr:MAG: hypothetical protein A2X86_22250 [Bdellovibrionales bacterium GWA2_49_15]HAZ14799.1 error-prone repair protein UmuD [Bdellovibrionales bacterium]